jgi:hypothetical protein
MILDIILEKISVISLVVLFTTIFLVTVESWGQLLTSLLLKITNNDSDGDFDSRHLSSGVQRILFNITIGVLPLGMWLFLLGILNLLYPSVVLISTGAPILITLVIRWSRISQLFKSTSKQRLITLLNAHRYSLIGFAILSVLGFIYSFNVSTEFDATWYHLTIPKTFLMNNSSAYIGEMTRYSVHPYLNFFFALVPLSYPVGIALKTMIVGLFQFFYVIAGIQFGLNLFYKYIYSDNLPQWIKIAIPSVVTLTIESIYWFSQGYNDLYAYSLGFVVTSLIMAMSVTGTFKPKTYFTLITIFALITLSLFKLFFIIAAAWIGVYWLFQILQHYLIDKQGLFSLKHINKAWEYCRYVIVYSIIAFVICILPWLIRSYVFTGRILDPVGQPGLTEDLYAFAGSENPANHFGEFIWVRLLENIIPFLTIVFTPLITLSLVHLFTKQETDKNREFHATLLMSWLGFGVIYFMSVVLQWRYQFPFVPFMVLGGVYFISLRIGTFARYAQSIIAILLFAPIIAAPLVYHPSGVEVTYLFSTKPLHEFVKDSLFYKSSAYYINPNTPGLPDEYSPEDTLFTVNIFNIGLIENPVTSLKNTYPEPELSSAQDVKGYLISEDIDYVLFRNILPSQWCELTLKIPNPKECNTIFTRAGGDQESLVTWYTVT